MGDPVEESLAGSFETLEEAVMPVIAQETEFSGAVAWRSHFVHNEPILGQLPTGQPVEITGCTLVAGPSENLDEATFTRFVDWVSVMAQIGVTFNTKAAVIWDQDQYDAAMGDQHDSSS